jgi:hypothetical protein
MAIRGNIFYLEASARTQDLRSGRQSMKFLDTDWSRLLL